MPENQCETVIKQETDNECKIVAKNVCELVDKPSTKYVQVRIDFEIDFFFNWQNIFNSKVSVRLPQALNVKKRT